MTAIELCEYVEPQPRRLGLLRKLQTLWAALLRWRQQRRTLTMLSRLDPRLLTDMGFKPQEIYAATDGEAGFPERSAGWSTPSRSHHANRKIVIADLERPYTG
jgi:uncharacterized protein YjiS (DUF1127 family)